MKKAMNVIGIIVLVIAALIAVLWVKNLIDANKPYVSDTYYNDFPIDFDTMQFKNSETYMKTWKKNNKIQQLSNPKKIRRS